MIRNKLTFLVSYTIAFVITFSDGQLMSKEHRTHAASEKVNDLWCYRCDTMNDKDNGTCSDPVGNYSMFIHKCQNDSRICTVKKFSYTTSTENSTSSPKLWSLERNCTNKCEPGCIVIGERTKLYSCTTCCETSLCNIGTGTANELTMKKIHFLLALTLQAIITMILYQS